MQEQERVANEEAEKRLKAALTAKREPAAASQVASPSMGHSTSTNESHTHPIAGIVVEPPPSTDNNVSEDVTMDADTNTTVVSPLSAEVRSYSSIEAEELGN